MILKHVLQYFGFTRWTTFSIILFQLFLFASCTTEEFIDNSPDPEFQDISFDHPLSQKLFHTLETRMDQVLSAYAHGVDFHKLNRDAIKHASKDGDDFIYVPFEGEFNGNLLVLVGEIPSDGASVKILFQETAHVDEKYLSLDTEYHTLDFSLSVKGKDDRGVSAYGSVTDEINLDEVVVTAPVYIPPSYIGLVYSPARPTTSYAGSGNTSYTWQLSSSGGGPSGGSPSSNVNEISVSQVFTEVCGTYKFKKFGGRYQANLNAFNLEVRVVSQIGADYDLFKIRNLYITIPEEWFLQSRLESTFKNYLNAAIISVMALHVKQWNMGIINGNTNMSSWYNRHFKVALATALKATNLTDTKVATVQNLTGSNVPNNKLKWCV